MTRAAWAWAAAAGAMLTAGVGCYSPPPYSPGYGYPAYQTAPTYPAAPGGVYPGGSFVAPGGTMPGTLGPSSTMPGAGPTLAPPAAGDAPPATFAPGSAPPGNMVPDYDTPGAGDFDSGNGFGTPPEDGFQPPASGDGATGSPFYEGTSAPRPLGNGMAGNRPPRNDYLAGVDDFQLNDRPALPANLAGGRSPVRPAGFQDDAARPADFGFDPNAAPVPAATDAGDDSGFGYDKANYAWLRGVIDYDPQRKNWHIIYGLPPDPNDEYCGSLTLADGGHLAEFRDSDVVMVQGRIDPLAGQDILGKPFFRVTKAELLGRFE